MKHALPREHRQGRDLDSGGGERPAANHPVIQQAEQIGHVLRDEVDDFQIERLLGGDTGALAHGGLGPVDVAVALVGDGLHVACGEVLEFLRHDVVGFCSPPNPPSSTGCAAPMLVLGAIAATSAASVMKQPALPALAPAGAT